MLEAKKGEGIKKKKNPKFFGCVFSPRGKIEKKTQILDFIKSSLFLLLLFPHPSASPKIRPAFKEKL